MTETTRSLTDLAALDRATLLRLLDSAEEFTGPEATSAHRDLLAGEAVALLFCEPSTRTHFSFELAAKRLGADVLSFHESASSHAKGETLAETISTLAAMNVRYFAVRHAEDGIMDALAAKLPPDTALVSAGEGTLSHPTQGLLDTLTIRLHHREISGLTVAIVGDIAHSRVARSAAAALQTLGVGALRLVGPKAFLPAPGELPGSLTTDLDAGLEGADVIMALRIQRERMEASALPDLADYVRRYGLNIERIETHAKPDALLLHPGPVNWGVELAPELADWPRCLIREQVRNGVAVRMAVLARMHEALGPHV